MAPAITRLFDNYDDAAAAVSQLEAAGVPHHDISLIGIGGFVEAASRKSGLDEHGGFLDPQAVRFSRRNLRFQLIRSDLLRWRLAGGIDLQLVRRRAAGAEPKSCDRKASSGRREVQSGFHDRLIDFDYSDRRSGRPR